MKFHSKNVRKGIISYKIFKSKTTHGKIISYVQTYYMKFNINYNVPIFNLAKLNHQNIKPKTNIANVSLNTLNHFK